MDVLGFIADVAVGIGQRGEGIVVVVVLIKWWGESGVEVLDSGEMLEVVGWGS